MLLELMLLELELVPVLLAVLLVLVLVLVLVPGCGKDEKVAIPDGLSGLSGLLFVGVCGRFRASSAMIGPVSMEQKAHHESVYYLLPSESTHQTGATAGEHLDLYLRYE